MQVKQTDFSAVSTKITGSGATALFFGGYYTEAGLLLKQLKGAGWKGTMIAGDGVNDANFIKVAGEAVAEGTILTCPCAPATAAKGTFVTDYKAAFDNAEPGTYADVSFDITNIVLEGYQGRQGDPRRPAHLHHRLQQGRCGDGCDLQVRAHRRVGPGAGHRLGVQGQAGKVVPDVEIPKS